jgi:hypothetical protein
MSLKIFSFAKTYLNHLTFAYTDPHMSNPSEMEITTKLRREHAIGHVLYLYTVSHLPDRGSVGGSRGGLTPEHGDENGPKLEVLKNRECQVFTNKKQLSQGS